MNRQTIYLLISLAACGLAAPLWAQDSTVKDRTFRLERFGSLGAGRFYQGDIPWESNRNYGGAVGVQPLSVWRKRVGFEFEGARLDQSRTSTGAAIFQTQTVNTTIFQNLRSRLQYGTMLYHFGNGARAQPFASLGIAYMKADYGYMCNTCVFDAESGTGKLIRRPSEWGVTGNKIGFTFGGGMKFAINRHLSIRSQVQFADTTDKRGTNLFWLRFQLGLVVHF